MREVRILALLVVVSLSSCASWRVSKPEWRLMGIQVDHLDRENAALGVVAQISNPNPFGVTVRQIRYRFYLKETLVGEGAKEESFTLPRRGRTQVILPVEVAVGEVRRILPQLRSRSRKDLEWRLEGECTLKAFGAEKIFPFKKEGGKKSEEPSEAPPAADE